jgi:DNA-binding CsgD family transcriptional regulator
LEKGNKTDYSCKGLNISQREGEVIKLVAEGFTNKEIAEKLFLSPHTVLTHRKRIMAKLGIGNTAGLVMYAIRENLIRAE